MSQRHLSILDHLICGADRALRSLTPGTQIATRPTPQAPVDASFLQEPSATLEFSTKRHTAGLMRVNHSGEVCAQALYQGQALTAKLAHVRQDMEQAADEEIDHLAWCEQRLVDLDSKPSLLNPLWYGLSFGLGAITGLISDRVSLGFVAATEEQVCEHLKSHLGQLPESDLASRAIINQMLIDEEKHGHSAIAAGGLRFPKPLKAAMTAGSRVMTSLSYRI